MPVFPGPRIACNALNSVVDDIGDPIIKILERLPLPMDEMEAAKMAVEKVLSDQFCGEKISDVKSYIHELARNQRVP